MSTKLFDEAINIVIDALRKAGYDPYDQLYGYVSTGELSYITRQGNARAKQSIQMNLKLTEKFICVSITRFRESALTPADQLLIPNIK